MNCSEFEAVLNELVESRGRRLPDEAITHQQSCASCRQLWRDCCLLDVAIVQWRPVEPPSSLTDLVLRSLLQPPASAESRPMLPATAGKSRPRAGRWGVAASAACVVLAGWLTLQSENDGRRPRLAEVGPSNRLVIQAPLPRPLPIEVSSSVTALLTDLNAEYRAIANETTATARDIVSVLPPSVAWPSSVLATRETGDAPQLPQAELGRSIGNQLGQAMGFLWQSVPSDVPSG